MNIDDFQPDSHVSRPRKKDRDSRGRSHRQCQATRPEEEIMALVCSGLGAQEKNNEQIANRPCPYLAHRQARASGLPPYGCVSKHPPQSGPTNNEGDLVGPPWAIDL